MEHRPLGATDTRVSLAGLGTMTFGEQTAEAEAHAMLDMAADAGVTLIDAAELYPIPRRAETQGATEEMIGSWLAARGGRDRFVIATKVVGRTDATWFRADGRPAVLDRANIREAVERSLRRLRTDVIDLYQVHWPDRAMPWGGNPVSFRPPPPGPEIAIAETHAALAELVAEGKLRHIGISNESAWGAMTWLRAAEVSGGPRIASIQNAYSLVNRTFETALAEVALRERTGLLAYSPLAQGYLTAKYRGGARPAGARKTLYDRLQRYEKPGAEAAYEAYFALARELGLTPVQLALKFVSTRPFVTSVLVGASGPGQLAENLAAMAAPWSDEIEARVEQVHLRLTNPCP